MVWKKLLIVSGILFSTYVACDQAVKIYYLNSSKNALTREQDNEAIPFNQAEGYLCLSPPDFKIMVEKCASK